MTTEHLCETCKRPFLGLMKPVESGLIERIREEIRDMRSLPVLGATSEEEHLKSLGRLEGLEWVLTQLHLHPEGAHPQDMLERCSDHPNAAHELFCCACAETGEIIDE